MAKKSGAKEWDDRMTVVEKKRTKNHAKPQRNQFIRHSCRNSRLTIRRFVLLPLRLCAFA
jgi:hypothetical protein